MKRVQKVADEFFRKQGVSRLPLDYPVLREIIQKNGWELLSYAEADLVIKRLNLEKYRYTCQGFTYQSKDGTLIFIRDDLGYLEKIKVICHEIGHIVLLHTNYGILGKSECPVTENIQEAEADVFSLEMQAPGFMLHQERLDCVQKIINAGVLLPEDAKKQYQSYLDYLRTHQTKSLFRQAGTYCCIAVVSFMAAMGGMYLREFRQNAAPAGKPEAVPAVCSEEPAQTPAAQPSPSRAAQLVYVTPSGKKYHLPGCRHTAGRTTIPMAAAEAQALGYTPCKDCAP